MRQYAAVVVLSFILSSVLVAVEGSAKARTLLNTLFPPVDDPDKDLYTYLTYERPVASESDIVQLRFQIEYKQLIGIDVPSQIVSSMLWLKMTWWDYRLRWDKNKYNISTLMVPISNLWYPDVLLYNSADSNFDPTYKCNAVVNSEGVVSWNPPGIFKSTCKMNVEWFPFDEQNCTFQFSSWTYDITGINMTLEDNRADLSGFNKHSEWSLMDMPSTRVEFQYACCAEKYVTVYFHLILRRRPLFYLFNLVLPCLVMSLIGCFVFTMPTESGERLTLIITLLVALSVFQMNITAILPVTSDSVPLLGTYFAMVEYLCCLSVLMTIVVINFHFRNPDFYEMPKWVKFFVCGTLGGLLGIKRPGDEENYHDKDYRPISNFIRRINNLFSGVLLGRSSSFYRNGNCQENKRQNDDEMNEMMSQNDDEECADLTASGTSKCETKVKLRKILKELKFLTTKIKEDDESESVCADWRYAALVIDKLCFYICVTLTLLSIILLSTSAPSVWSTDEPFGVNPLPEDENKT